jgi:hypothetical protein
MRYAIKNVSTGKKVEIHESSEAAYRACCIVNAHELAHKRPINYQVEPACEIVPFVELDLPDWALKALLFWDERE